MTDENCTKTGVQECVSSAFSGLSILTANNLLIPLGSKSFRINTYKKSPNKRG